MEYAPSLWPVWWAVTLVSSPPVWWAWQDESPNKSHRSECAPTRNRVATVGEWRHDAGMNRSFTKCNIGHSRRLGSRGVRVRGEAKAANTLKPKPSTHYGQTATTIGSQIIGCTNVVAGDVGKGGPSMASTATCMLSGRMVTINSWTTVEAIDDVKAVLQASKKAAYFAQGEGWTVTATDDPDLQRQMTNDAAALLASALAGKTAAPPDLPGQRTSAEAVVASLDGTIVAVHL